MATRKRKPAPKRATKAASTDTKRPALAEPIAGARFRAEHLPQLERALELGLPRKWGAQIVGITESNLSKLISAGERAEADGATEYTTWTVRVAQAVRKAEAASAHALVSRIVAAAAADPKYWTAAAWLLERSRGFTKPPDVVHVTQDKPNIVELARERKGQTRKLTKSQERRHAEHVAQHFSKGHA